jgi:hypothetical protein
MAIDAEEIYLLRFVGEKKIYEEEEELDFKNRFEELVR